MEVIYVSTPRQFLLVGNGPYLNRGCEAIVRGTATILRRKFGDDSIFVNASLANRQLMEDQAQREIDRGIITESLSRRKWSIQAWCDRINRRAGTSFTAPHPVLLKHASRACVAMEIGGDNYSLGWRGADPFFKQHIDLDRQLRRLGVPTVIWGASIGPFTELPEAETLVRGHLRTLDLILVRETRTEAYLKSIGVEENVRLVADPAFAMDPVEPTLPDDIRAFIETRPIGLNLSPLAGRFREGSGDSWKDIAGACIQALVESGMGPVLLVPHVTVPGGDDYQFMLDLAQALPGWGDSLRILPPTLSATEYKWVISHLRAIAAARTHATVAGFSTGVPTLSIGYSSKAKGINQDIYGHTDWCVSVDGLHASLLVEKMRNMLADEDRMRTHLTEVSARMRMSAYEAADHLESVVRR